MGRRLSPQVYVLAAIVVLAPVYGIETRMDPESQRIRAIYGVAFGNALMITQQDPRFDVHAVIPPLTYERTMADLEYSKRLARIYMPRTYDDLVENTDLIIVEIDTRAFTPDNHAWFRDAVLVDGLGFVMGGGSQGFGGNPPFTNWCETHVDEILPVDCHFNQRYPKGYIVRLKIADPENGLARSIPWESAPLYYPPNVVTARPGCRPIIVSDDERETLIYFYWDVGKGRSVGVQNMGGAFCKDFDSWEFYPDTVLNTFYFAAAFPLPNDLLVVHELRASWHQMNLQRSLLLSLIEFADKFGANAVKIEEGMRDVDSLKASSDSLYINRDYLGALRVMKDAISKVQNLQELSVQIKKGALLWTYLIEWFAVLSTLMVSGFTVWTLMIKRAAYKEVAITGTICIIRKSFHPPVLGASVRKMTDSRIRWMMRRKEEGRMANTKIARVYNITTRRLQQLWARYRSTGQMPTLSKPGRPKKPPDPLEEELVLQMWNKHHVCAVILEHLIHKEHGRRVPHNRIHTTLVKHGYAKRNPRKQRRRRWIRFERKHSMSLWHLDWYEMEKIDPQLGEWLLTVQDDASRKIMGWGVFDNATSTHSVHIMEKAVDRHGVPDEVITDKGPQFWAVDSQYKKKGYTEFEKFLQAQNIGHILARTKHPQTNGKIERLFLTLASQIGYHTSFDDLVDWYNTQRPHMSLGMATPEEAFWNRLSPERMLGTASHILYQNPGSQPPNQNNPR